MTDICSKCKKETLILIDCRCGKSYCMKHKDKHKCHFDYHQNEKERLEKKKVILNNKLKP